MIQELTTQLSNSELSSIVWDGLRWSNINPFNENLLLLNQLVSTDDTERTDDSDLEQAIINSIKENYKTTTGSSNNQNRSQPTNRPQNKTKKIVKKFKEELPDD